MSAIYTGKKLPQVFNCSPPLASLEFELLVLPHQQALFHAAQRENALLFPPSMTDLLYGLDTFQACAAH